MKESMYSVGGLLLCWAMTTSQVFGQEAPTHASGASQSSQVERKSPQPVDSPQTASSPQADGRRHAAQLSKLHIAMKKKLGLNSTQEKSIERLFRRQIAVLNGKRGAGRSSGRRGSDPAELASLRERLQAARKAGDERALRRLRQEFREKIAKRSTASALSTDDFLARVSTRLSGDQQAEFWQLARSMRSRDRRGRSGTGELRKFWRVVSSPAVGLSSEQRRTATGIMRDGVADLSQAQKDGTDGALIIADVRRDVLKQLNPGQLAKVEIALGLRPRPVPHMEEPEPVVRLVADQAKDAKPEVKAEPQPKAEPASAPKVEPKPEPKPDPKPVPKEEAPKKPSSEPQAEPKPQPAPKPEPAAKPEPEPKSEKDSDTGEESDEEEEPDKDDDG